MAGPTKKASRELGKYTKPLLILTGCLAVPIVPFIFFHETIETYLVEFTKNPQSRWTVVAVIIAALSTDILLPIPSSFVSTFAGGTLSIPLALFASWIGMNLGAIAGFALSKRFGKPLAERLASTKDLERMEQMSDKHGPLILVTTRALPILAEASVLMMGMNQLSWRKFLPPVLLSNFGISLAYAALGRYAAKNELLPVALGIAIGLPFVVASIVRSKTLSKLNEP